MRLRIMLNLILVNMFFMYSCKNDKNEHTSNEIISVFSNEYEELVFDSIRVIPLQTTEGNLLGNNIKVLQQNCDDIYIGDMEVHKKVFRFNKEGAFLNTIGVNGRGPKEYLGFSDFTIDNTTIDILAVNGSKSRVIKYMKNGNFIADIPINLATMSFEKMDSIYLFSTSYQSMTYSNQLHLTNMQGGIKESYLHNKSVWNIPITDTKFSKSDSSILFREALDNCVYVFKEGKLNIQFQFDFGNYSIEPDFLTKPLMTNLNKLNKKGFGTIKKFFGSTSYFAFEIVIQKDNDPTIIKNIIYNKATKNIKEYNYLSEKLPCLQNLVGITKNDELIYLLYPHQILDKIDLFMKLPINNKDILKNIKILDNPILFYCSLEK